MSELQDRYDIQDQLYHYGDLIDSGNNARVAAEIFAPNGVLDFGGATVEGYDAIQPFYASNPKFTKYPQDLDGVRHDITNIRIRFSDPDHAESNARVTAWHWHRTHRDQGLTRPADLVITGIYHDEWVRLPHGWRILRRRGGQSGTGIGIGTPPESMKPLFEGLLGRLPTWNGGWIDTPFLEKSHE